MPRNGGDTVARAAPRIAFDRAMQAVSQRLEQLDGAIARREVEEVEYLARGAVNVWLAGRVAFKRFVKRNRYESKQVQELQQDLLGRYDLILDHLQLASKRLLSPQLEVVFVELRQTIVAALATRSS